VTFQQFCEAPGCSNRQDGPRCHDHERAQDRARGTAHERLYDARWTAYSRRFRRRHPLCWYCLADRRTTASECVDHIQSHRGNRRLFWAITNHAAACLACNTTKENQPTVDWPARARAGQAIDEAR
jgi:5-methylcytosine-specific restriction protein A